MFASLDEGLLVCPHSWPCFDHESGVETSRGLNCPMIQGTSQLLWQSRRLLAGMQETPERKLKKHLDKSAIKTHSTFRGFSFPKLSINPEMWHFITSHDRMKQTSQSARGQDLLKTLLSFTCDLFVKLSVSEMTLFIWDYKPEPCKSTRNGIFMVPIQPW